MSVRAIFQQHVVYEKPDFDRVRPFAGTGYVLYQRPTEAFTTEEAYRPSIVAPVGVMAVIIALVLAMSPLRDTLNNNARVSPTLNDSSIHRSVGVLRQYEFPTVWKNPPQPSLLPSNFVK